MADRTPADEKRESPSEQGRERPVDRDSSPLSPDQGTWGELNRLGDEAPSGTFRIPRI